MLEPRRRDGPGPWEIFGLTTFGLAVATAGVVSWRWARQGPPSGPALNPGGHVAPGRPVPGAPAPGPKAGGYDPREGPAPARADWTQPPTTGVGYQVRNPGRTWGTKAAVASLLEAMERWERRRAELGLVDDELAPLVVRFGDMSRRGGGPFPPHKSHQRGRDIDLSFRKRGGGGVLPMPALVVLLEALLQDANVAAIFLDWNLQREVWDALQVNPDLAPGLASELQYPLAPGSGRTRVRHWDGHRNHLHVRFRQ